MGRKKRVVEVTTTDKLLKYKHDGFEYMGSSFTVEDTYRVEHRIVETATGNIIFPDFTQYCFMSRVDFENYVRLGFPKRIVEYRPLSSNDLKVLSKAR